VESIVNVRCASIVQGFVDLWTSFAFKTIVHWRGERTSHSLLFRLLPRRSNSVGPPSPALGAKFLSLMGLDIVAVTKLFCQFKLAADSSQR